MTRHDGFIGRFVVFHKGHLEIISRVYNENRRPVLVMIMDTDEQPSAEQRQETIRSVLEGRGIPHELRIIPPIASINWGRNVGYETNYIHVPDEIQQISGTSIREMIADGSHDWKEFVPE